MKYAQELFCMTCKSLCLNKIINIFRRQDKGG